jgi:aspartyl-tRNA(Asn)/glutamyl-tRNA(Gln) amidotransferase subunit B
MERGNLRADANISIRRPGDELGNRVEIKNLNSIRFLGQALDYEIDRQIRVTENGEKIKQETRLFDSNLCETRSMRSKEDAEDYRYFPEPDLKPIFLDDARISKIKSTMPELPDSRRNRFIKEYCIPASDANILIEEKLVADYFEKAVLSSKHKESGAAKLIANWMIGELFAFLNKNNKTIEAINFPIEYIAELVDLILDGTISGKIAKTVFVEITEKCASPITIVEKLGLTQIGDEKVIKTAIEEVIKKNPAQVAEYKAGKVQIIGFFVGSVMRELHGRGNPKLVNKLLEEYLNKS